MPAKTKTAVRNLPPFTTLAEAYCLAADALKYMQTKRDLARDMLLAKVKLELGVNEHEEGGFIVRVHQDEQQSFDTDMAKSLLGADLVLKCIKPRMVTRIEVHRDRSAEAEAAFRGMQK
ncbi:MAG: hypothetical protein FJ276_23100 [Planctomycetes bacterium]|nr:hypothetical protein [Planctomycetota bacterium]